MRKKFGNWRETPFIRWWTQVDLDAQLGLISNDVRFDRQQLAVTIQRIAEKANLDQGGYVLQHGFRYRWNMVIGHDQPFHVGWWMQQRFLPATDLVIGQIDIAQTGSVGERVDMEGLDQVAAHAQPLPMR